MLRCLFTPARVAVVPPDYLDLAEFQANAGTGTATTPANINNNDTATAAVFDAVDEYVEIDFGKICIINAYRYYGFANHAKNGTYLLQYWDGAEWIDHVWDILTRTASWSEWFLFESVTTSKIRIVATKLDTFDDTNHAHEWEVVGTMPLPANLTVDDFRTNAGTGTVVYPDRINDDEPTHAVRAENVGEYAEVDFGELFTVREFKYYGHSSNVGDGTWTIQYLKDATWVDLNTIPTTPGSWSDWIPLNRPYIVTQKIRWVLTVMDSYGNSYLGEVEMRG